MMPMVTFPFRNECGIWRRMLPLFSFKNLRCLTEEKQKKSHHYDFSHTLNEFKKATVSSGLRTSGYTEKKRVASGQVSNSVASLENNNVRLTFNIPSGISESKIPIRLVTGNGPGPQDVLFITKSDFSVKIVDKYVSRLTVTSSLAERKVYVDLQGVRSADAGMYTCYDGINYNNIIANCGQKLVIVRKPNKPTIQELTSALEGANLKLACMTNSTSLPTDHGLKSAILWRNEQNQIIGAPGTDKLSMDADGHLVIKNIQRTDKGRKLTCTSSDIAEGITSSPESDQSQVYEVKPEFKPSVSDIVLKPPISGDDKISKKDSEDLTYTCDTTCDPACTVQWSFKSFSSSSFVPLQLADPKTLKKTVQRADHGTYRCSATNKHGVANKDFELEVLYISSPVISLNDKTEDNIKIQENQPVTLKCVIDALPAPKISWKSNKVLSTETGKDPKVSKDNVLKNVYTSVYSLSSVQCEDHGVYSCEVTNEVSTLEGRINMVVLCPPTRADVDGLKLEQEYVWELSKSLTFSFVIKAFPEPNVIKVTSKVKNDPSRDEVLTRDVSITKSSKFDGKDYLTKFTFTSLRNLDLNDKDRTFTMTFDTSESKGNLDFVIRPRGPPQTVTNITALEIRHDSIKLAWMAGFNGGETQHFDVEYRHFSLDTNSNWNVAAKEIKDPHLSDMRMEAVIQHLDANTDYQFRIKSTNSLGSVESEPYRLKTADDPDEALSAGGIAGIVIAVIVLIVIVLIVLYVFLYRRKWGKQKETGESRKSMLPDRLTKVFTRSKTSNVKQEPNGITISSDKPKHASIFKNTKLLNSKSKPKELYPNRKNSEEESDSDHYNADDHSEDEDGDYINTELRKMEPDDDEYLNEKDYRQQIEKKRPTEDGLNYVSIDFKNIQKARDKKKKKAKPAPETGPYSQIDFEKTQALRQKMLAEDTEHIKNEPIVDTSAEDNDDRKRQPLELMGTAV
ncbi:hypothetical protein Btru_064601 [Bulinus truncatus]|nr:hypothetical protein Btru_064601 [Bulinus truncatus]